MWAVSPHVAARLVNISWKPMGTYAFQELSKTKVTKHTCCHVSYSPICHSSWVPFISHSSPMGGVFPAEPLALTDPLTQSTRAGVGFPSLHSHILLACLSGFLSTHNLVSQSVILQGSHSWTWNTELENQQRVPIMCSLPYHWLS